MAAPTADRSRTPVTTGTAFGDGTDGSTGATDPPRAGSEGPEDAFWTREHSDAGWSPAAGLSMG